MKRLLLAPALLFVLAGPAVHADAPPKIDAPVKAVVVPFDLLPSGHMAVMAKVNGEGPYRLIFDTGARSCCSTTRWRTRRAFSRTCRRRFSPFSGRVGR